MLALVLPYPAKWIGSWEGPAVLNGHVKGRLRLDFDKTGTIVLSEIERDSHGHLYRSAYKGKPKKVAQGLTFDYHGVTIDADRSKNSALAGEFGTWFLGRLRLTKGVLSGIAYMDSPLGAHHFLLKRRKV